ncbi:sugar phosphate permease with 11 transmembrane domains [Cryptosporidium sp. chipmunk genotype I]|uniref:sugar phosphate permease with 11 transmembrane domains n=1 Tax=Cryptosporidium sp. chipmunk genotype I TaxID=1280935 RepID=UPI00351A8002|nr:sugar phosphate permease with 11 transmembrane domains [Cryptosporidium sp. chipmunk genotype I]
MEELKLNNANTSNYCEEEEIDLCVNDELRLFDRRNYLEKYESCDDSMFSTSTSFPSCDGSSKSSRNFNSIDNLCMLMGNGGNAMIKPGLVVGQGDECQKMTNLENFNMENIISSKRRLIHLRYEWFISKLMDLTMMKKLLPSMSKDEYKKFFLAYLSYLVLYSTRKPFSVVKLQIQEDLSLSTSVLGWIDTTFLGSYAFGQLIIPTMFETFKVNEYICISFICSAITSVIFGISNSPTSLLLSWFFNGLFHAGVYPMLVKYLITCFGVSERGRILGVWTTSQQVGAMVSTAFSASICLKLGWRSVFFIPSIFVFLFGLIILKHLKKPRNLYIYDNVGNNELSENNMVLVMVEDSSNIKAVENEIKINGEEELETIEIERSVKADIIDKGEEYGEELGNTEGGTDEGNVENEITKYSNLLDSGSNSLLVSPSQMINGEEEASLSGLDDLGFENCQIQDMSANSSSNGGSSSQLLLQKNLSEKENDSRTKLHIEDGDKCTNDGFGTSLSIEKSEFSDHISYIAELSPTKKNRRQLSNRDITSGSSGDCTQASNLKENNMENNIYSSFDIQNIDDVGFAEKLIILLKIPNILNIAISYYFIKLIRYSMLFWLPYYLIRELNYGPSVAGYSSMLFDIGGIAGAISAGAIADTYFGGKRILVACYMTTFVSLSILYFMIITKMGLNLLILFGIAFMGFCVSGPDSILGSTAAQDVFDKSGITTKSVDSMATGIVNGLGAFGAVTQGTLTAYISEYYGWSALFLCLLVFSTFSFLILIPASYTKKQKLLV